MFKIAKLEKVNNENITIDYITQQRCGYELGNVKHRKMFNHRKSILEKNL